MKTFRIWDEKGEPRNVEADSFTVNKQKVLTLRRAGIPEKIPADKWVGIVEQIPGVKIKAA